MNELRLFIGGMNMGCKECGGKGYFEYETGVVSEHIPYIREVAKEPCDCVLNEMKNKSKEELNHD